MTSATRFKVTNRWGSRWLRHLWPIRFRLGRVGLGSASAAVQLVPPHAVLLDLTDAMLHASPRRSDAKRPPGVRSRPESPLARRVRRHACGAPPSPGNHVAVVPAGLWIVPQAASLSLVWRCSSRSLAPTPTSPVVSSLFPKAL